MCGIIGIISSQNVCERLIQGLRHLEYRGYDSAGIAIVSSTQKCARRRSLGKIRDLEDLLERDPIDGLIGIGHTRWATHGGVTVSNAHPHGSERLAVVHNGIIENHAELRDQLMREGYIFESDTDTETLVHLFEWGMRLGIHHQDLLSFVLEYAKGTYSFAVLFAHEARQLWAVHRGSPLVIGHSHEDFYIASDIWAMAPWASSFYCLEPGEKVLLEPEGASLWDANGTRKDISFKTLVLNPQAADKGVHRHYMIKEIFEQPVAVQKTLEAYISPDRKHIQIAEEIDWTKINTVRLIACGTSYYAGMIAQYGFERIAGIQAIPEIASEFRYRDPVFRDDELIIVISQSGETLDTLGALRYVQDKTSLKTLGIVNVAESSMAREVQHPLLTLAGPEIGVASTKAFTCQITVLNLLMLKAAYARGRLSIDALKEHIESLCRLPSDIEKTLLQAEFCRKIALTLSKTKALILMGRGSGYPVVLEGALKIKEIAYIHASGYAAGELKHGPISLIDPETPVLVWAPHDPLFPKIASNIQEVCAREGRVFLVSDFDEGVCDILVAKGSSLTTPILGIIPFQLLAYYTGLIRGTDIDQPRNLAKSVTVE